MFGGESVNTTNKLCGKDRTKDARTQVLRTIGGGEVHKQVAGHDTAHASHKPKLIRRERNKDLEKWRIQRRIRG